jgi:ABC-2 type transport system ATP-binding protein
VVTEQAVAITGLEKTYPGRQKKAVDGLNLTVQKGDFFGLLGPNGAGKSTTLNILSQLILKDAGKIVINGWDLDTEPFEVKNSLGIVPQEFNFNMFETPYQIILQQGGYYGYSSSELRPQIDYLLDRLDLKEHAHRPSRTLSGGMKRRLMIARGLIHHPAILILDEPTAGVDVQLRLDMWDFLKEINAAGTTIILTSHYLEEIELLCRHVGIIDKGVLLTQTSTAELTKRVDGDLYEVRLGTEIEAQLAHRLEQEQGFKIMSSSTIQFIKTGQQDIMDKLQLLAGYKVISITMLQQRLEDVFLSALGNKKRDI